MRSWSPILRRYALFMAVTSLVWETLQLPLYTIWNEGTRSEIAFAVVHCAAGDVLIALGCLSAALIVFGHPAWPSARFPTVASAAVAVGVAYTVCSEWRNVEVHKTWAYSEAMPRVPPLETGLSPILQWLTLPPLGLWWARRISNE